MTDIATKIMDWNGINEAVTYLVEQKTKKIELINRFEMHSLIALQKKLNISMDDLMNEVNARLKFFVDL